MVEHAVNVPQFLEELDGALHKKDYASAERVLLRELEAAEAANDRKSRLTVLNEQIGLYRKLGRERECLQAADAALESVREQRLCGTVTGATTFINAATGYKAFGRADCALPLYRQAKEVYEKRLGAGDGRLAALYNNMALTLTDLQLYDEALALYEKAIDILQTQEHPEPDTAVTYLNMADLVTARYGPEQAERQAAAYLDRAESLLDTEGLPKDGYYAFVCEKCAPVFEAYGYFRTKQKLERRASEIYNRLQADL